jgi:hypothetical protein
MSDIHQMLSIAGGSFKRAEEIALEMIKMGNHIVLMDLVLLYHAQGKIIEAKQANMEYMKYYPDCPRGRFGQSWFKLYDGDLENGLDYVESGRAINCFGKNNFSKFICPRWNGDTGLEGKVVLLQGEGGQGDHIMAVRCVKVLKEKFGAKEVIVGCANSLMGLLYDQGEFGVADGEYSWSIKVDYWLPMMSSFRLCKMTWDTLWPGPWIKAPKSDIWDRIIPQDKLNIGIRWCGNPEFEHEQLRRFPAELMFDAIKGVDANFWSLQKDDPQTALPDNIVNLEQLLGDWRQTAAAIARMDLVISSCTSVAHLAAAMGKPTWVIVPVLSYYPWARPGSKTHWYPSITLFRQRCFGVWDEPFSEINQEIKKFHQNIH